MAEEHARWKQYEYAANSDPYTSSSAKPCKLLPRPFALLAYVLLREGATHLLRRSYAPLSSPSLNVHCEGRGGCEIKILPEHGAALPESFALVQHCAPPPPPDGSDCDTLGHACAIS
jgi:hypothetical protein